MKQSSTPTLISALRILARQPRLIESDDGVANMAIAEAADRMEEMQTREKKLSQKLCCFTGESLEDAADRLREEHNKAKNESDAWKERATRRMGLAHELREAMGIEENMNGDAELKAALAYVKKVQTLVESIKEIAAPKILRCEQNEGGAVVQIVETTWDSIVAKEALARFDSSDSPRRTSRPTLDQMYP
jgi:Rad3-related DNA helicase